MKELSLNILDITENSVKAKASLTEIVIREEKNLLTLTIRDNGVGMKKDFLKNVTDPFTTTRTTRKVGMGLPLLKLEAEQTGGSMEIRSTSVADDPVNHGTEVKAVFYKDHIDFTPLGDVVSTIVTLIQGHPDTDFLFLHETERGSVSLDTREIRKVLGNEVPLSSYEVISWIEESLRSEYDDLKRFNKSEEDET